MIKLGVNLDHVATIRQQRYTPYPDMLTAINIALDNGADSITMHLREDRRHIQIDDIMLAKENIGTILNLEMAATNDMLSLAKSIKPDYVCIVPEKRQELTTEGGLDLKKNFNKLENMIKELKDCTRSVSLFIEPSNDVIQDAKKLGADAIEIHTGLYADSPNITDQEYELNRIKECAIHGDRIGLRVNAGHGLHYENTAEVAAIKEIRELNIGHSIISKSIDLGIAGAVQEMKAIMAKACLLYTSPSPRD